MQLRKNTVSLFLTAAATVGVFALSLVFTNYFSGGTEVAWADDVSTSITVLNTPPQWTVDAEERWESSTASSTNSGDVQRWDGTATDPSDDDYFLLICKSSSTPTANAGAPPSCGGGVGDLWAVSATTTSAAEAIVSTTTVEWLAELNDWFAYICDGNTSLPRCHPEMRDGSGSTASPFVVNHRPSFTIFIDDGPTLPNAVVTWYSTSTDADTEGGDDDLVLWVCKAQDFVQTIGCGAGGTWASTTFSMTSDAAASTTIVIPTHDVRDGTYAAYGYIVDDQNHSASGGAQATDSVFVVANATPSVTAASIILVDTDGSGSLELLNPNASTTGFEVEFTATDANSCLTQASGQELVGALPNVYTSGTGSSGCDTAGEYDPNFCYSGALRSTTTWIHTCTQDAGTCSGATDTTVTWTCTFSLWHIARPTDGASLTDSTWFAENWLGSVEIRDDDLASSTLADGVTGNEVASFMAFNVATTSIAYASLEPGQSTDPIVVTTDLLAYGNVGLDQELEGDDMCPSWSGVGSCNSIPMTSRISADEQVYATSSLSYTSPFVTALSSTTAAEVEIDIEKATTTEFFGTHWIPTKDTYWGIQVPGAITTAGEYTGQNTITGIKGEAQFW